MIYNYLNKFKVHKNGGNEVIISTEDINFVNEEDIHSSYVSSDYLESFELYLLAHTGTIGAKNSPNYYFTLSPSIASNGLYNQGSICAWKTYLYVNNYSIPIALF